ncbi:UbiA family prenyltransferase [Natronospora cellulosivora (SeqCode)]
MLSSRMRIWKGFWQLADPKIWIASTIPMLVSAAISYNTTGTFNFYWFFWTVLGIYLIEIGKNAINEFVDYNSGVDQYVEKEERTPFSGGKKTIVDGRLSVFEVKIISVISLLAAVLIGLYIVIVRETGVFWLGLIGFALAISYSLPPFKLAYRGLGEITVGLTFGPLIMIGTYLVQTNTLTNHVILISLPFALLITNILWINQYPDYNADKKGNKMNWVVRLGRKKAVFVYEFLFLSSYISIIVLFVYFKNPLWLLPFISLPLVIEAIKTARKYYDNIPKLLSANAKSIQIYQLFGLTLFLAAILDSVFF